MEIVETLLGVPYLTSYAGKFTIDMVACLELIRSISGRKMLKIGKFGTIFFFEKKLKMYLLLEFIWYPNEILTQETYGKSKKNVRARILIFVIFHILCKIL